MTMKAIVAVAVAVLVATACAQDQPETEQVRAELLENAPIGEDSVPPPPPGPPPASNTPEDLNEEAEARLTPSARPSDASEPMEGEGEEEGEEVANSGMFPRGDDSDEERFELLSNPGFRAFPAMPSRARPEIEIDFGELPPVQGFPGFPHAAPHPAMFPGLFQSGPVVGHARPPMPDMEFAMEVPMSPVPSMRRELLGGLFEPVHHPIANPFSALLGSPLRAPFHHPHPMFMPGMHAGFGVPPLHLHPMLGVSPPPFMPVERVHRGSPLPVLQNILDTVLSELPKEIQERHSTIPSDHQPMVLKIEKNKDFYVVTGWFPGVQKSDLKINVEGSNLKVAGAVSSKTDEDRKALGEFADIEEVDETMELPYAPDSRFVKAHFDEDKHTLTVVFPQEKTSSINLS